MLCRNILIVGATGQQGRATIAALYTSVSDIILVEGDTKNPASIFQQHPDITSIFFITVPSDEVDQARPLIEAAVAPGRKIDHLVFSSVDRGGNHASRETPTNVPHFAAKHKIEHILRHSCDAADRNIRWMILRPTGFMDNFGPSFLGKFMATLWEIGMPTNCKMQLVSTRDIGIFAAKALSDPDTWAGRAVGLAKDELTLDELR
ncbi:hypothetical protein S40293_10014 [Stachybotrys chartarum IBT 40293]|nr:hypothetical protein S40293_10014 [Stachybotrys chartarum IBT 40293]